MSRLGSTGAWLMRISVRLARAADNDLDAIITYLTREAGRRRAEAMYAKIRDKIELLRDHPRLGPLRESLGAERRILIVPPYIVVYRIDLIGSEQEEILVLRVVHGARDLEAIINE